MAGFGGVVVALFKMHNIYVVLGDAVGEMLAVPPHCNEVVGLILSLGPCSVVFVCRCRSSPVPPASSHLPKTRSKSSVVNVRAIVCRRVAL